MCHYYTVHAGRMMVYTRVNVIKSSFEKQRRRKEVKTLMSNAS